MIFRKQKFTIKLKNGAECDLKRTQFSTLIDLLGAITFSTSCSRISDNKIELSFDMKNKFVIPLNNLSSEDEKLLALLFNGCRFGANFITNEENDLKIEGKTLKITEINKKKIIETGNGLKFYLDSITPGIIIETYVQRIHDINPLENFNGKIVVDVGAECGDTALYYASKGAKVYSFEPLTAHYEAMIRNIGLNPEIASRIVPINAAIGKDGVLKFYHSNRAEIAETASFVYNTHGKDAKISYVKGYSLRSAYVRFNIDHVDLLKMDCKGCEFFLNDEDLKNVAALKIEYWAHDDSHRLEELLIRLKKNGFQYMIYRHTLNYASNLIDAVIYAKKNS